MENTSLTRQKIGERCGWAGVGLNLLLFAGKLAAGLISGSVAITGDALNNLSDAGSSLVTLLGFRIAGKRPDKEHPFGHGRMEYVAGLLVSVMILFMGLELLRSSAEKIFRPSPVEVTPLTLAILAVSIAVKLGMAFFNRFYSRKIDSEALLATAVDSRNDAVATAAVLLAALAQLLFRWQIDGYCGLAMSIFILISGVRTAMNTVGAILGREPDAKLVQEIQELSGSHPGILGVHDIVVHDYGPGRVMASLHVEVSADGDLMELHSLVEHIEDELEERLGCRTVIHIDPVAQESRESAELRHLICGVLYGMDPALSIHDFRVTGEGDAAQASFDVLAPYTFPLGDAELKARLTQALELIHPCRLSVRVDRGE